MASTDDILRLSRERLATLVEAPADSMTEQSTFAELGLDSAMAVHFVLEIEDELGIELYPEVTGDYPTLGAFAAYVAPLTA